jgi:nucleoside-diphosphate-sugar epimerase
VNISASSDSKNDGLTEALGQLELYKIVVFGGSGLIGSELVSKIDCIAPSSKECDTRDFGAVQNFIKQTAPTLVINLAGESRADRCNSDAAWSINTNALTNICYSLATYCRGAKLFQAGSINEFLSPASDYARQKTKASAIANSYSRIIDFIDAKLCTVENGYREGFIISELARMTKTYLSYGSSFTINDMSASKWVVDAGAMSDAIIECCAAKSGGQFYFGPQTSFSLEEIFCEICYQLGINTVKNGKSWIDADSGRTIMNSRNYHPSSICARNFGEAFGGLKSDLRKIINTIIVSS